LSCVEILLAIKELMKPGDTFILSKGHAQRAVDVIQMPGQVKELITYGGSLGNGIGIGLGIALAKPDNMVYVVQGDGENQEGSVYEAYNYIIEHAINNIRIITDGNSFGAYGKLSYEYMCNGHKIENIKNMLSQYVFVVPKTVKGKGIPELENTLESHYHKITKEEMEKWCAN
jgi:transketolase